MANRFPLILDTTDSQIKELGESDNLNLTGNSIIGVQNITATGIINASSILINDVSVTTSISYNNLQNVPTFAPVATSGIYGDLNELPVIPSDLSQLTDNLGLLSSGNFTGLSDTPDSYAGKSGPVFRVNVGETGLEFAVISTSEVTSQDIVDALGYTPYNGDTNSLGFLTSITDTLVVSALGYTPYNGTANSEGFISDSQGISDALGYIPYDGTTNSLGFLTSISSTDVTDALGYTPYNATNPSNFISLGNISGTGDISFNQNNGVISFNNSSGFLTAITDTLVVAALGYTPYNGTTNPAGFINNSQGISDALGYTPYNGAVNSLGFLTAEADTLATVTSRGGTTTNNISVGAITASSNISGAGLTLTSDISFNSTGSIVVDGGSGSSIRIGGTSNVILGGTSAISVQQGFTPNNSNSYDIGTSLARFANLYVGQGVYFGTTLSSNAATATFSATGGSINVTTAATGRTHVTTGTFRIPNLSTIQRTAVTPADGDMIYEINRIVPQIYFGGQWRDILPQAGSQPATPWFGMIAVADGVTWNPKGDGSEALMCYLNDAWAIVA
jgi:hypothetical protein